MKSAAGASRRALRCVSWCLAVGSFVGCSGPTEPTCPPVCPGARDYDAQSYELIGHFDWTAHRLVASERVSLVVHPPAAKMLELDATVDVKRVHADAADLPYVDDRDASKLFIDVGSLHAGDAPITFNIEYEAPVSDALRASSGRDGDPVTTRVVYTDSEPFDGRYWLPADHRPFDRATWTVELTVASDEDVIANGMRAKDEMQGGARVIRYEMDKPVPTYLMAFAAGQLEHQDRTTERVPLSVWHRRGLVFDPAETLDRVTDAMSTLRETVGPVSLGSLRGRALARILGRHGERHDHVSR